MSDRFIRAVLFVVIALAAFFWGAVFGAWLQGDLAHGAEWTAPDGRSVAQLITAHVLPDPATTPGVINPAVNPNDLKTTLCAPHAKGAPSWIALQRPPPYYSDALKLHDLPAGWRPEDCEEDHLSSIEDGGSPTAPRNLWCMVYRDKYGARVKDRLETKLHRLVCAGKITLAEAQAALAPNWLIGYQRYVGPLPK